MANCIARATGYDSSREKNESRLGSVAAKGVAATWKTEATAFVRADGSGYVEVRNKDGSKTIHTFEFGPESER